MDASRGHLDPDRVAADIALKYIAPRSCAAVITNDRRQDDGSSHGFSGDLSNMIGEPGGVRLGAAGPSPQCWYRAGSPDQAGSLSQSNDPTDAKRHLNDEGGETSAHRHNAPDTGFLFLRRLAPNRRKRIVRDEEHSMELITNGFDIIEVDRRLYHFFDRDQCVVFVHQVLISAKQRLPIRGGCGPIRPAVRRRSYRIRHSDHIRKRHLLFIFSRHDAGHGRPRGLKGG